MGEPRAEQALHQVLAKRVAQFGDKPWIVAGERSLSYREIDALSNRVARGIAGLGPAPGETVLFMLPDTIELILSWCGLAKLGAIEVPVNTHLRGNVLAHIINDSRARWMIVHPAFLERIEAVAGDLRTLDHLVLVADEEGNEPALPPALAKRFTAHSFAALLEASDAPLDGGPTPRDLMAVMYTSGTTGPAKGVMITHIHAWEYAHSCIELLEIGPDDVYYAPLPLFHIAGQWATIYAACIAGATAVLPRPFSVSGFWSDVRHHGATCTFLLGAMANLLHRQEPAADDADNPLDRALVVPLLPELEAFTARFGCRVSTTWGATEINVPTRSGFDLPNTRTCGYVADHLYEVRIVDENDYEVPVGVPGEAVVRAKEPWITMAGYWNNPEGTAWAWRNQWLHSGDVLMRDEAGWLYFVDRVKDAIRRRGENISSMEVEQEINAHPAVLECAVVPVADELAEQEVMAVIVAREGAEIDPVELIRFAEPRMAYFMVPRYIDVVDEMPRTPTGKIRKVELRERGLTPTTWDREAAGIKLKR